MTSSQEILVEKIARDMKGNELQYLIEGYAKRMDEGEEMSDEYHAFMRIAATIHKQYFAQGPGLIAIHEKYFTTEVVEREVGTLTKAYGTNGNKTAEIGSPVFEDLKGYYIYLHSLDEKKPPARVYFYKETLRPNILFHVKSAQ